MSLLTRAAKGARLTWAELDAWLTEILNRLPINNAQPTGSFYPQGSVREKVVAANVSGAYAINLANGGWFDLTLTAATTLTFPAALAGQQFILALTQGAGGPYAATYSANVRHSGGAEPSLTTTVGRTDVMTAIALRDGLWQLCPGPTNYTLA